MAEVKDLQDLQDLRAAKEAVGSDDEDVFEEGMAPKDPKTIHHVRANSTIMHLKKLLVANRGEIPIRIFRTAHELSLHTIAVFSYEDRLSMHRQSTYTMNKCHNGNARCDMVGDWFRLANV